MTRLSTVTELVVNFRDACRALVPNLDRAHIPWTDLEQYDGWDRIAETLFESLVAEPCWFQASEEGLDQVLMARYGFGGELIQNAFISVVAGDLDYPFIKLVSLDRPFSHALRMVETGKETSPIEEGIFAFVVVDHEGKKHRFTEIDLDL